MSNPKPMTYIELKNQYEKMLFKDLPLFDFKNVQEFCRALPDVIQVQLILLTNKEPQLMVFIFREAQQSTRCIDP